MRQGTFSWSAVTPKITSIAACIGIIAIGAVVASCIQAQGSAECYRVQSVQCCPFSWSALTPKITTIAACIRKITIDAIVASCVDTSLGPLQCLVAVDKDKTQN
jgi:predicted small integral membrane protein